MLELEDPGPDGVIVLELSSYQLEITPSLALDAGAVINITPVSYTHLTLPTICSV